MLSYPKGMSALHNHYRHQSSGLRLSPCISAMKGRTGHRIEPVYDPQPASSALDAFGSPERSNSSRADRTTSSSCRVRLGFPSNAVSTRRRSNLHSSLRVSNTFDSQGVSVLRAVFVKVGQTVTIFITHPKVSIRRTWALQTITGFPPKPPQR